MPSRTHVSSSWAQFLGLSAGKDVGYLDPNSLFSEEWKGLINLDHLTAVSLNGFTYIQFPIKTVREDKKRCHTQRVLAF